MDWSNISNWALTGILSFSLGAVYSNLKDTTNKNQDTLQVEVKERKIDVALLKEKHNEDFKKLNEKLHNTDINVTKNTALLEGLKEDSDEAKQERRLILQYLREMKDD